MENDLFSNFDRTGLPNDVIFDGKSIDNSGQKLSIALENSVNLLQIFAQDSEFVAEITKILGGNLNLSSLTQQLTKNNIVLPSLEILEQDILGNTNGVYSYRNNTIYFSRSFLQNASIDDITVVLIEQFGNYIQHQSNSFAPRSINPESNTNNAVDEVNNLKTRGLEQFVNRGNFEARCDCSLCGGQNGIVSNGIMGNAIVTPPSDNRIASLLGGYKWGITNINYSFFSGGSYYGSEANVGSVSEAVKNTVRYIFANVLQPLINLNFVEVTDSPSSYGQIRFLSSTSPDYAYAYYPYSTDTNQGNIDDRAGDVFLNPNYDNNFDTNGFQGDMGTHGYETLIHEILHALGLKHPGDYNGNGSGDPPFLPFPQDNNDNTVMTYHFAGASASTAMPYDLLALQYLYGARSNNNGNTTYAFSNVYRYSDGIRTMGSSTSETKLTIWDSGGIDTLDFSALTSNSNGYRFDLTQGGWLTTNSAFNGSSYQAIGDSSGTRYPATTFGTRLGINVDLENIIGTGSNDNIIGNALDNVITGGRGNDVINGGDGIDTVVYSGVRSEYQISGSSGAYTITDLISNRDGVDTLTNLEIAHFSDQIISLTTSLAIASTNANQTEGNSGTTSFTFTVTRSGTTTGTNVVNWAVTGSGTNPANATDFVGGVLPSGTVSFGAGETSKIITVNVQGDTVPELDETFAVTLSNPTNGATITTPIAIGTILNDDMATDNTFSNTSPISIPGSGSSTPYPSTISVLGLSGNITKATITLYNLIHTYPDDIDILLVGPTGAKTLLMSDVGGGNVLSGSGVNITFDATASNFLPDSGLIGTGTYKPTNIGEGDLFSSPAPSGPYGTDLSLFNNTSPNGTWSLYVMDDFAGDSGSIGGGWSLTLETSGPIVTPQINISGNQTIVEGLTSPQNAVITVSLSQATTQTVTVQYATVNDTAIAGSDYTSTTGTLIFNAGETSKTINIPILNDNINEPNEIFTLNLSNPTNGVIATATTTITITDTLQSNVTTTLPAEVENLTLTGTENINGTGNVGANRLTGNSGNNNLDGVDGNDTLTGGDGNDSLNGGIDADRMVGGKGDDTYYVDNTGDRAIESVDSGIDTVHSTISYGLKNNLENLILEGIGNINGSGNTLNNSITGNSGNNRLNGGDGNDTLTGGNGNDSLKGDTGADTMVGGWGNDLYYVDNTGDQVIENANEGTDTVRSTITYSLGSNLEKLILEGITDINGTGNTLNNSITGNRGNNLLSGGDGNDTLMGGDGNDILTGDTGADRMVGGKGDDTYYVDHTDDRALESVNSGIDTVRSTISYGLKNNLENLILEGTANINGSGNTLNNSITGNSGNNNLNGGTGADTMVGGWGNDLYYVDNTGDQVIENANEGTDTVRSTITYSLGSNLEKLILEGITDINGTGNTLNNSITGNRGNNLLSGGDGNDTLIGGDGNDILTGDTGADRMVGGKGDDTYDIDNTGDRALESVNSGIDTVRSTISYGLGNNLENLILEGTANINGTGNSLNNSITGNSGNNTLNGGVGNDTLTGGIGQDFFRFNSPNEGVDIITDFNVTDDRILIRRNGFGGNLAVGTLLSHQFTIGSSATTSDHRFFYNASNGGLFFDIDGDGITSAVAIATLNTDLAFSHEKIIII